MRVLASVFLCILIVVSAMPGCVDATSRYVGDGTFVDHGWAIYGRYEVILGEIAFDRAQELRFRMAKLPRREFNLGIRLNPETCSAMESDSVVRIVVTNERGEGVVREEHLLKDLQWMRAQGDECRAPFGYAGGDKQETPLGDDGGMCVRAIITGADNGRGTYFIPRTQASYDVTVSLEPGTLGHAFSSTGQVVVHDVGAPPAWWEGLWTWWGDC
jgi:hypothetical protein